MFSFMSSEEYLAYLIKNCGVRGYDFEERTEVCLRPDVDMILDYAKWLDLTPATSVLEVGCGIGRILFELSDVFGVRPSGADSFPLAIEEAGKRVGERCESLIVCPAEQLRFPDHRFDAVICWGVFDLTEQGPTLAELARVLTVGGKLLLTGKNNRFESDDEEAFLAERGSRRKGIPNHYTDFSALLAFATDVGLTALRQRFFVRRGDMMANRYVDERPERFYEYLLLLEKVTHARVPDAEIPLIGHTESRLFGEWSARAEMGAIG